MVIHEPLEHGQHEHDGGLGDGDGVGASALHVVSTSTPIVAALVSCPNFSLQARRGRTGCRPVRGGQKYSESPAASWNSGSPGSTTTRSMPGGSRPRAMSMTGAGCGGVRILVTRAEESGERKRHKRRSRNPPRDGSPCGVGAESGDGRCGRRSPRGNTSRARGARALTRERNRRAGGWPAPARPPRNRRGLGPRSPAIASRAPCSGDCAAGGRGSAGAAPEGSTSRRRGSARRSVGDRQERIEQAPALEVLEEGARSRTSRGQTTGRCSASSRCRR